MEAVYGSTRAVAIDVFTGQVIEPDCIQYGVNQVATSVPANNRVHLKVL